MYLSVVIPLYNKKATIAQTLQSVFNQTYKDFELIVVDDGSTDGSADLVAALADPRLTLIRQGNAGASTARNAGILAAHGDWIAFLDADDRYEPAFLETLAAAAKAEPRAVGVFSNMVLEDAKGSRPVIALTEKTQYIRDYLAWFVAHKGRGLSSSSSIVKRQALLVSGGFPNEVKSGEDTDTWFRLSWQGGFVYVAQVLATYNMVGTESLSQRSGPVYPSACNTIDARLSEGNLDDKQTRSARRAKRFLLQGYAASLALYGHRFQGALWLLKALPSPHTARKWLRGLYAVVFRR